MISAVSQAEHIASWLKEICPAADLYSDSREIGKAEKDAVFFAYEVPPEGARSYIAHAVENGAKAVVHEEDFLWEEEWTVPHLAVKGLKYLAGYVASAFYNHPSASMFVVAVTGTNGKTSCTQWIGRALSDSGTKTAVIGTLGILVFEKGRNSRAEPTGYTTPDQISLQRKLAELHLSGVSFLAIEASSIGIVEGRLNGLQINVVLFTNFTRDHLDYHKSMKAYEKAKRKLFDWDGVQHAVMNLDDEKGKQWARELQGKVNVIGYTLEGEKMDGISILNASEICSQMAGTEFSITSSFGKSKARTHLVGNFNVSNVLGVLGVLVVYGIEWREAVGLIANLMPPPGRMQSLGGLDSPLIVIDYAHTPDAMEKGLAALRSVTTDRKGELWCVFGCGGDRDKGKRRDMGRVSEKADHVIVTSDNPRNEDPMQIIQEIISGMNGKEDVIKDRASAILHAVKHAKVNDVIFLAGKGHETYQEVAGAKHPFVDAEHAALALATFKAMHKKEE